MTDLPSFESYGEYASGNYGVNALVFSTPGLDVYFSYHTPVAFRTRSQPVLVRQNDWGPTTGKHLNWIDGGCKRDRIDGAEFEAKLREALTDS